MSDPIHEVSGKRQAGSVSLEDLMKIKRAEVPGPKFWAQFDEELRAKQLAAIVYRPSWWQSLPRPSFRALWVQLPVGAMAVMGLSLVVVRNYHPASAKPTAGSAPVAIVPVAPEPAVLAPVIAVPSGGSIASANEISQQLAELPVAAETPASVSAHMVAAVSTQPAPEFERAFRSQAMIDDGLKEITEKLGLASNFGPRIPISARPAVQASLPAASEGKRSLASIAMARLDNPWLEVSGDNVKNTSNAKIAKPEMPKDTSFKIRVENMAFTTLVPRQG